MNKLTATILFLLTSHAAFAVPVQFSGNGNYYEYIFNPADYASAKADAESRTFGGSTGHLVTITSQAENDFVANLLVSVQNTTWLGAILNWTTKVWSWDVGPEAGMAFWNGGYPGIGGSPVTGAFSNFWITNQEPDIAQEGDRAGMPNPSGIYQGRWADGRGFSIRDGYVVEYSNVIPEPASLSLLAIGLVGWASKRRKTAS